MEDREDEEGGVGGGVEENNEPRSAIDARPPSRRDSLFVGGQKERGRSHRIRTGQTNRQLLISIAYLLSKVFYKVVERCGSPPTLLHGCVNQHFKVTSALVQGQRV